MLDNWQRIEKIVKWTGLSTNAFARSIGLNRSENLYQIKKGNNRISRELTQLIVNKYPNINKLWLLTGEGGNMFADSCLGREILIPFYDMDVIQAVNMQMGIEPTMHISLPNLENCDFAALIASRAMAPEIPEGSMLVLQESSIRDIATGSVCLVVSKPFTGVRMVMHEIDNAILRLVPGNTKEFGTIAIAEKQVTKLYEVKSIIIYK